MGHEIEFSNSSDSNNLKSNYDDVNCKFEFRLFQVILYVTFNLVIRTEMTCTGKTMHNLIGFSC